MEKCINQTLKKLSPNNNLKIEMIKSDFPTTFPSHDVVTVSEQHKVGINTVTARAQIL